MIKLLILSAYFSSLYVSNDTCTSNLVNYLYKKNYYSNYLLCLPVEVQNNKGRIILSQSAFKKYMVSIDTSYAEDSKLKKYIFEILIRKNVFVFYPDLYKQKFGQLDCHLFFKSNDLIPDNKGEREAFLNKYILRYNSHENDLTFNTSTPSENFYLAVEALFRMNFLVAISDGDVLVKRIVCE